MVQLHNGILHSRKKEEGPTLCNSVDGTGDYHASEISQSLKDKYCMISLVSRT